MSKFPCQCNVLCVNVLFVYDYDSNLVTVKALSHTYYSQCVNLIRIIIFRFPEHFQVSSSAENTPCKRKDSISPPIYSQYTDV